MRVFINALCCILLSGQVILQADRIETKDGSVLSGTIELIDEGIVTLKTAYAGTIEVKQSMIRSLSTDEVITVRLQSGSVMSGVAKANADGGFVISSEDGALHTNASKVASAWTAASRDPDLKRLEAERDALKRKWQYSAELNAQGKKGNTEKLDLGMKLTALLESPDDELKFYLRTAQTKTEKEKTADETVGGVRYNSYFSKKYGWYVREEIERDEFEGIDLRSTSAAGLTAKVWEWERSQLDAYAGAAYRYVSFINNTNEQAPALDFGIEHIFRQKDLFVVDTEISFVPSVEDTGSYLLYHDTGVVVPVSKSKRWNLRFGVSNAYNSEPPKGKTELDTTFYSGLILNWD